MFYVNMVDKFMSGWGLASRGRSLFIVKCETLAQAEAIEAAAQKRPEMRRISITETPRRPRPGDHVSIRDFSQMRGPWLQFHSGK